MKCLFIIFFVFIISSPCLSAPITNQPGHSIFNVLDYGASGNGHTDDTRAFMAAWHQACGATKGTPTLLIPIGKIFKLQPVRFEGPCKSQSVHVKVSEIALFI
ncbi:putative polygalacturonase [Lupinus albus]|uniref:Putative polygalacturonase n=1 Tax=Lupinus albus TaxID=3870 RepID=A0A6A4PT15_LUPAL|nr:putative polygalacturonase [Lupinus albus]